MQQFSWTQHPNEIKVKIKVRCVLVSFILMHVWESEAYEVKFRCVLFIVVILMWVSKKLLDNESLNLLAPTPLDIQIISRGQPHPLIAPVVPNEMSATWSFSINILVTSDARSRVGDT